MCYYKMLTEATDAYFFLKSRGSIGSLPTRCAPAQDVCVMKMAADMKSCICVEEI